MGTKQEFQPFRHKTNADHSNQQCRMERSHFLPKNQQRKNTKKPHSQKQQSEQMRSSFTPPLPQLTTFLWRLLRHPIPMTELWTVRGDSCEVLIVVIVVVVVAIDRQVEDSGKQKHWLVDSSRRSSITYREQKSHLQTVVLFVLIGEQSRTKE